MPSSKAHLDACDRLNVLFPALLSTQRASWEQGCAAQALLELHQSALGWADESTTLRYLYGLAHDAIARQTPDGRLAQLGEDASAADPACVGETLYTLLGLQGYITQELHDADVPRFTAAAEAMLRYVLECAPRGAVAPGRSGAGDIVLSHRTDGVQIWADTVYMLPPFLASAAVYYTFHDHPSFDPAKLVRIALRQIALAAELLQTPQGAWYHVYDLDKREFKRKVLWSVGNGWVCGGIVRVFTTFASALEADMTGKVQALLGTPEVHTLLKDCYHILTKTMDRCVAYRKDDFTFHNILDDPATFLETNISQQLSYTYYRMLSLHLHTLPETRETLGIPTLDESTREEWESLALAFYRVAERKTDMWGIVQGVCGVPQFDHAGTASEGQAWAVLMEVARYRYRSAK